MSKIHDFVRFSHKTNNPNPSPIGDKFGLFLFGPSGENRTHGLLNPIVLLAKTQWTLRYHLYAVSSNFKLILSFCFVRCQDVSFLLWSNCGQTTPTNDFSPPAKLHRAISIFINRSCAFCLHELSIRKNGKFLFQLGYTPVVSDMKKIVQRTVALSFPKWALAVWDMDTATLYMVKYDRSH